MTKFTTKKHPIEVFNYSFSKMLERASYYGLRAILVLYIFSESAKMDKNEARLLFGMFTVALVVTPIIGALLGDLLLGNKKAILLGGILQSIGAFNLCLPTTTGLYTGLFLIVLGSGLYSPNLNAKFGKIYLNKTKWMDAGFSIFYLAANIGSFLGVLLLSYVGETFGFHFGFVLSGILMLLSILPVYLSKETNLTNIPPLVYALNKRFLNIIIALTIVGIYWSLCELSSTQTYQIPSRLLEISTYIDPFFITALDSKALAIPISIIAIILWTFVYYSPFFKLVLGFIFGALSFALLLMIPQQPTNAYIIIYFIALLFLAISEIHIGPIIFSILTKYTNPKYLAILMSIAILPTRLFTILAITFNQQFQVNALSYLKFSIITMVVIAIGLIYYIKWNLKNSLSNK